MEAETKGPIKDFKITIYEDEVIAEPTSGKFEITIIFLHGMEMNPIVPFKFFAKGASLKIPVYSIVVFATKTT